MLGGKGVEGEEVYNDPKVLRFDFHRKSDKFLVMVLLELLISKCLAASSFREQWTVP